MNKSKYRIMKELPGTVKLFVSGKDLSGIVLKKWNMPSGTYGAMMGAMVKDGLVRAKESEENRRNKNYSLTVEGKKVLKRYEKNNNL